MNKSVGEYRKFIVRIKTLKFKKNLTQNTFRKSFTESRKILFKKKCIKNLIELHKNYLAPAKPFLKMSNLNVYN